MISYADILVSTLIAVDNFNKTDFVNGLMHCGSGKVDNPTAAEAVFQNILDQVGLALCSGKVVSLPKVGKLTPTLRRERYGRHPQTGDKLIIPATVIVKFTISDALHRRLQPALLDRLLAATDYDVLEIKSE